MRFFADGPTIPDQLLVARDEGRVVFFCGAGVSRAKAGLPDFFGLAKEVVDFLGVPKESPACKLIDEAKEIDSRVGVPGVISADRVFGLLEREFLTRDIDEAVSSALRPPEKCDLSAHEIILQLATTPQGLVRLVTTNFDRLFDACGISPHSWLPPRLPDPSHPTELNGVVYLHGKANPKYDGAEGDGFILSSAEFGRAYLADGWATNFVREIIDRYVVVFIGYSADDPPVQYLLEALSKKTGDLGNVYAFQVGDKDDATSRWRHKGVQAIAYSGENHHNALWSTLEAWATRANNPDKWCDEILQLAVLGPSALAPHERGQVAHLVSTYDGVRRFATINPPPPAEWLCVFDPLRRYASPGVIHELPDGEFVDPFDHYGLDSDIEPLKEDPTETNGRREPPNEAWSAFLRTKLDRDIPQEHNLSAVRGHWATHSPELLPRLSQLGVWLARVAQQPAALWWAAHQIGLHPAIRTKILSQLINSEHSWDPSVAKAWREIIDSWEHEKNVEDYRYIDLKALVSAQECDPTLVRLYARGKKPYLQVRPSFWHGAKAPSNDGETCVQDFLEKDVCYPDSTDEFEIPHDWVSATVTALRRNLEIALELETELGGYGLSTLEPLVSDNLLAQPQVAIDGLATTVYTFAKLFLRLIAFDFKAARTEFASWTRTDDTIFSKLRIWTSGITGFLSTAEFSQEISLLSPSAFWSDIHQRDLLLVIKKRWPKLSQVDKKIIETCLLIGPEMRAEEDDETYQQRKAWRILERLYWLNHEGCQFTFDLDEISAPLRQQVPDWTPLDAEHAIDSFGQHSEIVEVNKDDTILLDVPLSKILEIATSSNDDGGVVFGDRSPFSGFVTNYPSRAFSALSLAAKSGNYPAWAWRVFLNAPARKQDKPRLICAIAARISSYPCEWIATIIRPVVEWLLSTAKILACNDRKLFEKYIEKAIATLRMNPQVGGSSKPQRANMPDWAFDALNSPAGKLARALFEASDTFAGSAEMSLWLTYAQALLSLNGNMRRHALVMFSHHLNWLYKINRQWADVEILSVLEEDDDQDRAAFWAGFLWAGKIPGSQLFKSLKPYLLSFAENPQTSRKGHAQVLAAFVLAGWSSFDPSSEKKYISNEELRLTLLNTDEDFRSHVLWRVEKFTHDPDGRWLALLQEFVAKVWPKQILAKSSSASARLLDLTFRSEDQFLEMKKLVMPLLTKIEKNHVSLPNLHRNKSNIALRFPIQTLELLFAVLPEKSANWPYGIDSVLKIVESADENIQLDERFLTLKRAWDSR